MVSKKKRDIILKKGVFTEKWNLKRKREWIIVKVVVPGNRNIIGFGKNPDSINKFNSKKKKKKINRNTYKFLK